MFGWGVGQEGLIRHHVGREAKSAHIATPGSEGRQRIIVGGHQLDQVDDRLLNPQALEPGTMSWTVFNDLGDRRGRHGVGRRLDLHATVLYSLGLDSPKLDIDGRKRLEIDHGRPILDVFA